jgi:hypothetical protein
MPGRPPAGLFRQGFSDRLVGWMAVNFARLPELLVLEKSERIFDGDHDPNSLKPAAHTPGS